MSYILAKPIYIFLWNEKKTTLNIYEQNQRVLYLSALDSKSDKTEAYGLISEAVANTGVDCYSLFQRIFPIQGLNPGLLHHRQTLYHLSYREVLTGWLGPVKWPVSTLYQEKLAWSHLTPGARRSQSMLDFPQKAYSPWVLPTPLNFHMFGPFEKWLIN